MFIRLPVYSGRSVNRLQPYSCGRPAFTLLELLLVLGVLVTVASLSWPRMMRVVQENALKQNVETVRRELAYTRILAIESGLTYQFRFEPTAQAFVILPFDRPEAVATNDNSSPTSNGKAAPKLKTIEGHISSNCHFKPATDTTDQSIGGQRLDDLWLALLKNGALYTQTVWSPPILFRPNGESKDSQLVIRDQAGNTIKLTVRGLTGAVRVEPMLRPEVLP